MTTLTVLPTLFALAATVASAGAEIHDCRLTRSCKTDELACFDDPEPIVLTLTIADDGQKAELASGGEKVEMTLVDSGPGQRTFLAVRAGQGVGLLSLAADGTVATASNEVDGPSLIGVSGAGTCTPRNG